MLQIGSLTRTVALRYPLLPYRGRLPFLNGRAEDIPEGDVVTTRQGLRVRVRPDGMYYDVYFWGDYEPYHTKIYRRIVARGETVFDVGTNFGWYATLFAGWVGESGRVHAFEPVPFIHALAEETLSLNGLAPRVQLNRTGLGRERATTSIYSFPGLPHGHATAVDLARSDAVEHRCEIRTLDDYCEEVGVASMHFMKIDVEGFEQDVFLGGQRVLSAEDAPILAFEINEDCLSRRSLHGADVIGTLRELGYTTFFTFSRRSGVRRLESDDVVSSDCVAAKPARAKELTDALRVGRLLR